ncbi:hypothetical protein C8R45DRAFT_754522, partial [Mycena sanguinolenta]
IDVGTDRANLFFYVRVLQNSKNPVLDMLNIFPEMLDASTPLEAIPKCLFYFEAQAACRSAVDTIRKILPWHLRNCIYSFSSINTEKGKARCWEGLSNGTIRIVCATDAASMGCSIPDIDFTVVFGVPSSLAVLLQRWGRAGRARGSTGVCILFV